MGRLDGRTALITGTNGGIGAATAQQFAREGAQVVMADIDIEGAERVAAGIRAEGGDVVAQKLDLGHDDSIVAAIELARTRYGKLDILFNNAADTRAVTMAADGAIEFMDPDAWDNVFRINARGTMMMIKHALPMLLASGHGSIINTSSGASLRGDLFRPAYAASKAAINSLTEYVAAQYGKHGVRCNVVSPGMVVTDWTAQSQAHNFATYERHHLTPYLGRPEDIAAMVTLLASDEGRFVNGQIIRVDGGISTAFAHVADTRPAFEAHREAHHQAAAE